MADQAELFRFVQLRDRIELGSGSPPTEGPSAVPPGDVLQVIDEISVTTEWIAQLQSDIDDPLRKNPAVGRANHRIEKSDRNVRLFTSYRGLVLRLREGVEDPYGDLGPLVQATPLDQERRLFADRRIEVAEVIAASEVVGVDPNQVEQLRDVLRGIEIAIELAGPSEPRIDLASLASANVIVDPPPRGAASPVPASPVQSLPATAQRASAGQTSALRTRKSVVSALSSSLSSGTGLPGLPSGFGRPHAISIGELRTAEIVSTHYVLSDVAHIENVMASEERGRTHTVSQLTESVETVSSERMTRSENERMTTENMELQSSISSTIETSESSELSLGLTAGYGPVSTSLGTTSGSSSGAQDSNESARSFARSVLDRSVSEVRETIATRRQTRERLEVVDQHMNRFNNTTDEHIVGVYRFVDKVVESEIVNRGHRLMLEFVVPEPGAQLAATTALSSEFTAKPDEFTLLPGDIGEFNYRFLVAQFGANAVPEPPTQFVRINRAVTIGPADPLDYDGHPDETPDGADAARAWFSGSLDLEGIPDGYAPSQITVAGAFPQPPGFVIDPCWFTFSVANVQGELRHPTVTGVGLDEGSVRLTTIDFGPEVIGSKLTLAYSGVTRRGFAASVDLVCQPLQSTWDAWRSEVWELLRAAHIAQVRQHETERSLAEATRRPIGRSPGINRRNEQVELKQQVLATLTRQDFSHFGSVTTSGLLPQIHHDRVAAEAPYIVFFEDALEWDNIAVKLYDYAWAGRHRWTELLGRASSDPEHERFLRAGAARVIVPVQRGYEEALLRYLASGAIDNTGLLAPETAPLLESLLAGVAQGAPTMPEGGWPRETVRVPTSLVALDPAGVAGLAPQAVEPPSPTEF